MIGLWFRLVVGGNGEHSSTKIDQALWYISEFCQPWLLLEAIFVLRFCNIIALMKIVCHLMVNIRAKSFFRFDIIIWKWTISKLDPKHPTCHRASNTFTSCWPICRGNNKLYIHIYITTFVIGWHIIYVHICKIVLKTKRNRETVHRKVIMYLHTQQQDPS